MTEREFRYHLYTEVTYINSTYSDGYSAWERKKKLYDLKLLLDDALQDCNKFNGEHEWLEERNLDRAFKRLGMTD